MALATSMSFFMQSCSKDDSSDPTTSTQDDFSGTSGTYTDSRDNKQYGWIKIGTQIWTTSNLNYNITGSKLYEDDPANEAKYGRLYTWQQAQDAAPDGWRVATDEDWKTLEKHFGMSQEEADKLVQRGTDEGKKIRDALMLQFGGSYVSSFKNGGTHGEYWTSTVSPTNSAKGVRRTIANFDDHSFRDYEAKTTFYAVRLVRK